jgi:hypothetical protein
LFREPGDLSSSKVLDHDRLGLEGAALVALWRRLDHPGLKWLALAHLAAATARLVPGGTFRVLPALGDPDPQLGSLHLSVPATAPVSARWLAREELSPRPVGKRLSSGNRSGRWEAVAGMWSSSGSTRHRRLVRRGSAPDPRVRRSPARDLTVSIAWAIYAVVLLAIGVGRRSIGLRWVSLGLLMVTIAKVFLHDLGELRDLYRVASLLGLAVSLIVVSLAYQRFVFRAPVPEKT